MNFSKIPRITLWSSVLGHGLEMYDFTLYGAFTSFIALHFFASSGLDASFFSALLALSVGYIARPFGALIFGYVGDVYGRRKSLILTMSLASLATGTIGLCPSYASIGGLAAVVLFSARFTQGLCAGAETSDASVFLIEHCSPERSSYGSAMIFLSGASGGLVALSVSKMFTYFNSEWAWRIPFIIGCTAGILVLCLRLKIKEEVVYKRNEKKNVAHIFYLLSTTYSASLVRALACGALSGITSTTIIVFVNLYLHKSLSMDMSNALAFSVYGMIPFILSCYFCSKISSNYVRNRIIFGAISGLIFFSGPYFYLISTGIASLIFFAQIILGVLAGSFIAPINSLLAEQFPAEVRCTGVSVGYNTGYALTSGLYPILAFKLIELSGNPLSPAIFMLVFASIALAAVYRKGLAPYHQAGKTTP